MKLSFQVPAKNETLLVLDLVVTDFSDRPPRAYELAIKGYTNSKLVQKNPAGLKLVVRNSDGICDIC